MGIFTVLAAGKTGHRMALIAIAISPMLVAGVNEWTRVGPEGGTVIRVAADPRNPSTLYAGTCAGVFKSPDAGASWIALAALPLQGLPGSGCVGAVEIDPQNSGTVYVVGRSGIFKTTDGGASWAALNLGLFALNCTQSFSQQNCFQSFAIDPGNPATLYTSGNAIFKSTDAGATWTRLDGAPSRGNVTVNVLTVDPQNAGTVYAASGLGLFKSIDGGESWSLVHPGPARTSSVAMDTQNSSIVYYAYSDHILKSADGGASWNDVTPEIPAAAPNGFTGFQSIALNPQNPASIQAVMYQTSNNQVFPDFSLLFTSLDGGASWSSQPDSTLAANDLLSITPDPQDSGTWYAGTSNGILKTTGGGEWHFVNSGLRAVPLAQGLIDQRDGTLSAATDFSLYFYTHFDTFFKSTDKGMSWAPSGLGLPISHGQLLARPDDPRTLYTFGQYVPHRLNGTGLFRSGDAGASWTEIWVQTDFQALLSPPAFDPQNADIMYMGSSTCVTDCNDSIFKSTDAGRTWTQWPIKLTDGVEISAIAVDPRNSRVLYARTSRWSKSVDGGLNWVGLAPTDFPPTLTASQDPNTVYYADGAVHKSTDGGQTWTTVLRGGLITGYDILVLDPRDATTLYAGCTGFTGETCAIVRSTDAGVSWRSIGPALGPVSSIFVDANDPRTVYAAARGGLFAITLDATTALSGVIERNQERIPR